MSMKNDPKNFLEDDRDEYDQMEKVMKYSTKKDRVIWRLSIIGYVCIMLWIVSISVAQQFAVWQLIFLVLGLVLSLLGVINCISLTYKAKKFPLRSDLKMGYGNVKCYTALERRYIGWRRVLGTYKLMLQGENGKIYKTVVKKKYYIEEKVVFYYADDSDLCMVLDDEKAEIYLKKYAQGNHAVLPLQYIRKRLNKTAVHFN